MFAARDPSYFMPTLVTRLSIDDESQPWQAVPGRVPTSSY